MKCGIYVRVAAGGLASGSQRVATQQEAGEQYAQMHGMDYEVYSDVGKRREIESLIAAIEDGSIKAVWAMEISTLPRRPEERGRLIGALRHFCAKLVVGGKEHDPSDPKDRLFWDLASVLAQYESKVRAMRARQGRLAAKARKASSQGIPSKGGRSGRSSPRQTGRA